MSDPFPFSLRPAPKRGLVLTFILMAMMIVYGMTATGVLAYYLAPERAPQLPAALDPRLFPFIGLIALLKTAACIAVWRWQRWGVYVLLITAGVMVVADLSLPRPVLGSFADALGALLVLILCRRTWEDFA
ncbi:MAG TPA: hypothetical protein PLE60_02590 [Candidatus Latescibacteria bacterium]|nr:hypothetical protein [Candidatus Latescibacterota bacterium]